jgi:peptide-methionine (S)-S-oxide reductase
LLLGTVLGRWRALVNNLRKATFGAGCFWCVEAIFQRLAGVEEVLPGYSGGWVKDPDYRKVCTGETGHAEACQVTFDPSRISYEQLLEVFWRIHDPTTKDRQGNDVGTQYRSVIFYHDEEQKRIAEEYKEMLSAEKIWNHPIQTEIIPFEEFWPAESYHRNYFKNNPQQTYCAAIIAPKIRKFESLFGDRVQDSD